MTTEETSSRKMTVKRVKPEDDYKEDTLPEDDYKEGIPKHDKVNTSILSL